jgi:hypothetical protein
MDTVCVGVLVGGICDGVTLAVCEGVTLAVCDGVTLAVCDGVTLAVCDGVTLAVSDGVRLGVNVLVNVGVRLGVRVGVRVKVGVAVKSGLFVRVGKRNENRPGRGVAVKVAGGAGAVTISVETDRGVNAAIPVGGNVGVKNSLENSSRVSALSVLNVGVGELSLVFGMVRLGSSRSCRVTPLTINGRPTPTRQAAKTTTRTTWSCLFICLFSSCPEAFWKTWTLSNHISLFQGRVVTVK